MLTFGVRGLQQRNWQSRGPEPTAEIVSTLCISREQTWSIVSDSLLTAPRRSLHTGRTQSYTYDPLARSLQLRHLTCGASHVSDRARLAGRRALVDLCLKRGRVGEDRRCLCLARHEALKRGLSLPREESDNAKSSHERDHYLGGSHWGSHPSCRSKPLPIQSALLSLPTE